ncbi:OLC1v1028412C1 [Oldenlandia corymbosa var. corymbosa]|uniref:OLC1v1028412C1 n=1 Tax=Oldenlandia corymbosa var. corymbosa TaxID=529605 RepID=A0AAV1CDL2_OLDCO|nr:OLC1v1028412C1 [Oldenlandia corymbosa var. corymbosa]
MDFQQQHGYMRPPAPPPPAADPYYHHHHHHHHQGQRPPVHPPNQWYSNQFHYQHPSSSPQQPLQPPPPPPHVQQPPHQQWPPAPQHPDQFVPPPNHYPAPPPPPPPPPPYTTPYPAPSNQYPLPPHHSHHSLPPRHPPMPQPYPQVNQEWGPASWSHQQSWEYQANNKEEDWATKARAWAAYNVTSGDQQSQHPAYAFKDGSMVADSAATFSGQDLSISSSVHQQEVPSSYSSVAGDISRGMEQHVAAVPPDYNFVPPTEPALVYPPVTAMVPAGSQVDPVAAVPSPVPGHTTPIFGRMTGPSFQPAVASVAGSFGIVAGPELHPGAPFSVDSFGAPVASERPKKASVPNWLREEIIKNKPVIVNSSMDLPKEDAESTEDDYRMGDQKSIDTRSDEEEDDDEDDLEAARTAAINNEIKRIVTDVLLQVTAELFDEIATKVLSEDDPVIEDSKHSTSTLTTATTESTITASIPVKIKETVSSDGIGKFDVSRGDVLGLGSYASDDDESEPESSGNPNSKEKNLPGQAILSKDAVNYGGSNGKANEVPVYMDSNTAAITELKDEGTTSNGESGVAQLKDVDAPNNLGVNNAGKSEKPVDNLISRKSVVNDDLSDEIRDKLDKNDRHGHDRGSSVKSNNVKELETFKESVHEKTEEKRSRHDEGQIKRERRDDQSGSKESRGDKVVKSAERGRDSDSRKRRSPDYIRESRRERQTDSGAVVKEDSEGKRGRGKEDKREKPKDRDSTDSSRQNKHLASSASESCTPGEGDHHPLLDLRKDMFRGHLIASTLSAGILLTLLLRLPGGKSRDPDRDQGHLFVGKGDRNPCECDEAWNPVQASECA